MDRDGTVDRVVVDTCRRVADERSGIGAERLTCERIVWIREASLRRARALELAAPASLPVLALVERILELTLLEAGGGHGEAP